MSNSFRFQPDLGHPYLGTQQLVSKPYDPHFGAYGSPISSSSSHDVRRGLPEEHRRPPEEQRRPVEASDPWSHGCPQSSPYFLPQQPGPYPTPTTLSPAPDTYGMYYTPPSSYHASMPIDPFSWYSTTMPSLPSTQMHPQQQQQHGDHDPHQQNALQIASLHSQATGPEQSPQRQQQEETEPKVFDEMPVRKLGSMSWCRRCKIECESMEGLVIHSFTSEHQHKTLSLVANIKQSMIMALDNEDVMGRSQQPEVYTLVSNEHADLEDVEIYGICGDPSQFTEDYEEEMDAAPEEEEDADQVAEDEGEERKVKIDKELKFMQQVSLKKGNDDIFIKLGSDKEEKKENTDRDERDKNSLSINESSKPAVGVMEYLDKDNCEIFQDCNIDARLEIEDIEALAQAGLEPSNLIVGIDFTKSSEWTRKIFEWRRAPVHWTGVLSSTPMHSVSILASDTYLEELLQMTDPPLLDIAWFCNRFLNFDLSYEVLGGGDCAKEEHVWVWDPGRMQILPYIEYQHQWGSGSVSTSSSSQIHTKLKPTLVHCSILIAFSWGVKMGMRLDEERSKYSILHVFPFNSEKKPEGDVVSVANSEVHVHWKDTVEIIIATCENGSINLLGDLQDDKDVKQFLYSSWDVSLDSLERCLHNYVASEEPFDIFSVPKEVKPQLLTNKKFPGTSINFRQPAKGEQITKKLLRTMWDPGGPDGESTGKAILGSSAVNVLVLFMARAMIEEELLPPCLTPWMSMITRFQEKGAVMQRVVLQYLVRVWDPGIKFTSLKLQYQEQWVTKLIFQCQVVTSIRNFRFLLIICSLSVEGK